MSPPFFPGPIECESSRRDHLNFRVLSTLLSRFPNTSRALHLRIPAQDARVQSLDCFQSNDVVQQRQSSSSCLCLEKLCTGVVPVTDYSCALTKMTFEFGQRYSVAFYFGGSETIAVQGVVMVD